MVLSLSAIAIGEARCRIKITLTVSIDRTMIALWHRSTLRLFYNTHINILTHIEDIAQ